MGTPLLTIYESLYGVGSAFKPQPILNSALAFTFSGPFGSFMYICIALCLVRSVNSWAFLWCSLHMHVASAIMMLSLTVTVSLSQ